MGRRRWCHTHSRSSTMKQRSLMPLSRAQATQMFGLLSDETRLRLLLLLAERGEENVSALCEAVGQSQPGTSHHLMLLRMARVVTTRRRGRQVYYTLSSEHIRQFLTAVDGR